MHATCRRLSTSPFGAGRTSPTHFFFLQADREHRDIVSVLLCSPGKKIADLEKYNRLEEQPGCNKPQYGPQEAVQATCEEAGLSNPTTQHSDVPGWTYQGCYLDYVNYERLLTGASASLPNPVTPEWCAGYCSGTGTADDVQKGQTTKYTWMLLEYSFQCFCGSEAPKLLNTPSNTGVNGLEQGLCNSVCTADQTQICGGSNGGYSPASIYSLDGADPSSRKEKRMSHLHRHVHAHDGSF